VTAGKCPVARPTPSLDSTQPQRGSRQGLPWPCTPRHSPAYHLSSAFVPIWRVVASTSGLR
jgi:hypothetical protein